MFFVFVVSSDSFNRLSHLLSFVNNFFIFFCFAFVIFSITFKRQFVYFITSNNLLSRTFFKFFFAFFILHFPYPARAVQCFLFCIGCLSDEDYLITSLSNCQRFSCFLFISHNSDNSLRLLILYTKYLFSTSMHTKHIIILKNYYYSQ